MTSSNAVRLFVCVFAKFARQSFQAAHNTSIVSSRTKAQTQALKPRHGGIRQIKPEYQTIHSPSASSSASSAQAQALKHGHSKSKVTIGSQAALSGALPRGVVRPFLILTVARVGRVPGVSACAEMGVVKGVAEWRCRAFPDRQHCQIYWSPWLTRMR